MSEQTWEFKGSLKARLDIIETDLLQGKEISRDDAIFLTIALREAARFIQETTQTMDYLNRKGQWFNE